MTLKRKTKVNFVCYPFFLPFFVLLLDELFFSFHLSLFIFYNLNKSLHINIYEYTIDFSSPVSFILNCDSFLFLSTRRPMSLIFFWFVSPVFHLIIDKYITTVLLCTTVSFSSYRNPELNKCFHVIVVAFLFCFVNLAPFAHI